MPFGPVEQPLDLATLEQRVLDRWRAADVLGKAKRLRAGASPWVFYEGPPTANARPGLHHVWPRAFKDLFIRFQTMRGHDVPRKGGWDCHGLPVEIEVEKELGIHSKHEIVELGIEVFNRRCRESVQRYVADFESLTERAGVSIDTADVYWTLSNDYIESVWWLLRQLWDKGLLYEGYRVTPYCGRCGTALSSHELGQPGAYRDIEDPSVYVRFPVVDRPFDLLVWTTTPWTLISNVAAAVGPDIEYVRVPIEGERDVVLAAAVAGAVVSEEQIAAGERFRGADLVGLRYQRPFELVPIDERGEIVVPAGFVTTDEGTGIVHLAPAFGADDMDVARERDLPILNPVGPDAAFTDEVAPWAGQFVRAADAAIIEDLAARGLLVRQEPYLHAYPHCWRCGTALIYWAKTSWFVRTSERKQDLLAQNETIGWHPEHVKHGRFGDWLQNNVDWALSRDRFWGTPLPVWRCGDGHDTCVGAVAELAALAGRDLTDLDLHRPYVDEVVVRCPTCGKEARRLEPVLDAWFDSGSMPSAQFHYPFEGEREFRADFPADFICEAIDQTRGWFYSLLAINTLVFGQTPYRNVVCLALVVDQEGAKMSKSKGNVIDPWSVFDRLGADALRWYFFSAGSPWTARRVFEDGIREATGRTLVTLWNVFAFLASYADIDGWEPGGSPSPTHVLDRWVRTELDDCIAGVTTALDDFDVLAGAARLAAFVDDLSNWYVRRSRSRFWKASETTAHATLHHCLVVTAQLLAPFCPFLADELWCRLTGPSVQATGGRPTLATGSLAPFGGESVHLSDWPVPSGAVDDRLRNDMVAARQLVALGRAARTDAKVKVRQPLRRALLLHPGAELDDDVRREIAEELNVKALEEVESLAGLISWTVVPNFRALGPRLGSRVNEVKAALATADGGAIREELERTGGFEIAGERLGPDDVEIRANRHDDFALAQEGTWAVALDLELDDDLRVEGTARELIRAVNDLRKERGLALTDRIRLRLAGGPKVAAAMLAHGAWIADEVLASELSAGNGDADRDDAATIDDEAVSAMEIDGEAVQVGLELAG